MDRVVDHPRLSWLSRNLRVFMSSPPRTAECVCWTICLLSAVMFFGTRDLYLIARQFEYLSYVPHAQELWGSIFAVLAFAHTLAATVWRGAYKVRKYVVACHVVWSASVSLYCWTFPPPLAPADALYTVYVLCSSLAFLQLWLGTYQTIPD